MKFKRIKKTAFDEMQTDSGLILTKFDPTGQTPVQDEDIAFTTTGGVSVSVVPTYVDDGADVDGCPDNLKEAKRLTGWNVKLSTTALNMTPGSIKMALGAADVSGDKITPRNELKSEDFAESLTWAGDRMDGGLAAVKIFNALSTGGFQLKTAKNGKGQLAIEITGHVSAATPDVVPVEFYSAEPKMIA